jgi:hypothetical protein
MNPTCKNLLPQHLLSGYIQPKPLTWPLKESRSQAYTRTGARSHHFVCFLRAPSSSSWIDTKKQGGSDPQIAKMGGNLFLPPGPTTPLFDFPSSLLSHRRNIAYHLGHALAPEQRHLLDLAAKHNLPAPSSVSSTLSLLLRRVSHSTLPCVLQWSQHTPHRKTSTPMPSKTPSAHTKGRSTRI